MCGKGLVEMQPIGGAAYKKDGGRQHSSDGRPRRHSNSIKPLQQTDAPSSTLQIDRGSTDGRVKRNYLSMILFAYIMTVLSPGTVLWSPPSICNHSSSQLGALNTTHHEPSIEEENSIAKCMYGSINMLVLSKLTIYSMIMIILFFNLQGSNPGILTKEIMTKLDSDECNKCNEEEGECNNNCDDEEEGTTERQSFLEPLPSSLPQTLSISSNSINHKDKLYNSTHRKYCHKCQIYPPIRSHHCNISDVCIATFDHHCLFLNTCIGECNHCRFWMFVLWNVVCVKVALGIVGSSNFGGSIGMLLFGINNHHSSYQGEGSSELVAVRVGQVIISLSKAYLYSIYVVALLLLIIHTIIAITNCTTFEFSKGSRHIDYLRGTDMADCPFSKGLCSNIRMFIMRDDWLMKTWICRRVNTRTRSDWTPIVWKMPEHIERDSEDWWNHPWQNKYWSCC